MFELFGTMAPIPEWAGRRAAPPIDLPLCHGLFGRKEKRKPKDFKFYQHLFKKNPTGDIFSAYGGDFAQTRKRIFALEFFTGSLILL